MKFCILEKKDFYLLTIYGIGFIIREIFWPTQGALGNRNQRIINEFMECVLVITARAFACKMLLPLQGAKYKSEKFYQFRTWKTTQRIIKRISSIALICRFLRLGMSWFSSWFIIFLETLEFILEAWLLGFSLSLILIILQKIRQSGKPTTISDDPRMARAGACASGASFFLLCTLYELFQSIWWKWQKNWKQIKKRERKKRGARGALGEEEGNFK